MVRAERIAGPAEQTEQLAALLETYLAAVLEPDARRARGLVSEAAADGMPAARLYLDVLEPAMREVGRRWEQARVTVAQEHMATQITQSVLAELAARLDPGDRTGAGHRAIVSCSPRELHALGAQMLVDFLEADGWEVLALGADVPPEQVATVAREQAVDVVALSTALPQNLLAAAHACSLLHALPEPPFVVVGGQAYAGDPDRARHVGADAFAPDPETLLALLGERFARDGDRPG